MQVGAKLCITLAGGPSPHLYYATILLFVLKQQSLAVAMNIEARLLPDNSSCGVYQVQTHLF